MLGKPDEDGNIAYTNDNATIDEKLSLHGAIGKNDMFGGNNDIPLHIDFGGQKIDAIFEQADNSKIKLMQNGQLMLDDKGNIIT